MITKRTFVASLASLGTTACVGRARVALADTVSGEVLIKAETFRRALLPGDVMTDALRFVGASSPPVLRLRKGQEAVVRFENGLASPFSLQWHGLRGRGALDDPVTAATAAIAPGESRVVRFTPLDSGTAWFHAAADAAKSTDRGLRGVIVVEDVRPPEVDQDVVVLLADWLVAADGTLQFGSTAATARQALTTNDGPSPRELTCAPGSRIRLRLINGSLQRVMLVACEGARAMILAIDGQPSELFAPAKGTVPIAPAGRFDIVVDMPAGVGAIVRLVLKATERVAGALEADQPLLILRTAGDATPPRPTIKALAPNPALPMQIPLEASKRAELVIEGKPGSTQGPPVDWTINGVSGVTMPTAPVLKAKRGDAITLGFTNRSAALVPILVRGCAMRVLHAKDDGWDPYWRDTVLLPPGGRTHVAFVADLPGRWPIEAAFEDLAAAGLRCWFEVS